MSRGTFKRIPLEKQRHILDTAMREFAGHGFHKANINAIAAKAGISIGALYKYFSSKEDLFLDNHIMMFAFSQISQYLKIRQETFLEGRMSADRFIDETVVVCRRMFGTHR